MANLAILDCDLFALAEELLDETSEPEGLDDFAHYRELRKIGEGGMGDVYLANDVKHGRLVALKFIRAGWADAQGRDRFLREVQNLAQLEHPFIGRLYESGTHPDGTPFFAMEFVEGQALDLYCQRRQVSLEQRLRLFYSICDAVNFAHSHAVIHLDVKPSNILVKQDATPTLLDFGIARHLESDQRAHLTQTQVRLTPAFAAPEQFLRKPVGTYTDVYSLGIILYELLSGQRPYDLSGLTAGETEAWMKDERDAEKPSVAARRNHMPWAVSGDLNVICLKALKKNTAQRYSSVVELMQDLERYWNAEPIRARPASVAYRVGLYLRRNRRAVAVAAGVALVITGLTGFYLLRLQSARNAALEQAKKSQRVERFMLSLFGNTYEGPPEDLRVLTLLENGVKNADLLKDEPDAQADLYTSLGSIYEHLGKRDRAESLLRLGLRRREQKFGSKSTEAADSLLELAYLKINEAQFPEAEKLANRAVAIYRQRVSSDDPALARALIALGSVYSHSGRYKDGVEVLKRAIKTQSKAGPEDGDLVESLTYLASCQLHLGQNRASYRVFRQILDIDERRYNGHPQLAEDFSNLAEAASSLGKYGEAQQDATQAVALASHWYGVNSEETAVIKIGLGKTLVSEGKFTEGETVLRQAMATLLPIDGAQHVYVALISEWLGLAALGQHHLQEAEANFQRMSGIVAALFPGDKGQAARMSLRFGELCLARGQYTQAESYFRHAIESFSAAFAPDNPRTAKARVHLGSTLVRQRRFAEAEPEFLTGYRIATAEENFSPDVVHEAQQGLVAVYEGLKIPEKAARYQTELAANVVR